MTGIELKLELKKINITQEVAAQRLGVTRRTLQNWLSMDELDANISQNVKRYLGIDTDGGGVSADLSSEVSRLRAQTESQQRTIENLTDIIKNLTGK